MLTRMFISPQEATLEAFNGESQEKSVGRETRPATDANDANAANVHDNMLVLAHTFTPPGFILYLGFSCLELLH